MPKTDLTKRSKAQRPWVLVDLENKALGRAASKIAILLRGKDKASFTPNLDIGSFVIAINANKIRLSGKKMDKKLYRHHSGYPGGLKTQTARQVFEKHPDRLIYEAVHGMLPKNALSRQLIKKLKIYIDEKHPHEAQTPIIKDI